MRSPWSANITSALPAQKRDFAFRPQKASKRKQYNAINAFYLAQPQMCDRNALLNEKLIGAFLSRYPFPNGVVEEAIPPATPVLPPV